MGDEDPIVRTVATLHNIAKSNGICYVVVYALQGKEEENMIKCSFNVTKGFCSNFFSAVVWYWVQMNFQTHAPWEEQVLPYASRKHKTYCTDSEKVERAKTLLESVWKQQDFTKHKFMVVYAELSEQETVLFEECTEQDAPAAVFNTVKWIKQ